MKIGALNKRITIQQPSNTQDAAGAPSTAFVDVGQMWASIAPIMGREAITADQTLASMDVRIVIRHHPLLDAMNAKWRIVYNGVYFNIVSIANQNSANRSIELMCKTGTNAG